jgi:tetratricopeptide (TPR) repeat protein
MKEFFFWRVWTGSERGMAIGGFLVILAALVFFAVHIIDPLGNVVRWDVLSELSTLDTVVDVLRLDQWQYGVAVPSHLVTEQFVASTMQTDFLLAQVFLVLALIGLSFVLAALTTLSRFWYLGSMIAFILLLASARLETLGVLGEGSRALFIIAVTGLGGLSYYFHAFRSDLGVAVRFGGILCVLAGLALLVGFLSPVKFPVLTIVAYSEPFWLILTTLFLLIIATEIIAGFVWLSTSNRAGRGGSGLTQFLVISILYLLSLLLTYLRNTRQIDWDLSLISPVFLCVVSGLLGIWGFKRRADSTGSMLPFRSTAVWLYIGLLIISAAFGAYIAGTANDPVLEVLEDLTINSQLGMGIVFLFYVLVNFYQPMKQGLAVHKVLYRPFRFGLTQTRVFGLVGVIIFFAMQRLYPVYQSVAGYFNGLGDLYTNNESYTLAEQYYKMALQQDFQNHKSNYALASLALIQGDHNAAAFYFRQSLVKTPSAQAYAGLTNVLMQENLFFDAVYGLQEGIRKFPKSGELLNNLGMLYAKTNVADSAYYYLHNAERFANKPEVPATNLLAIMGRQTDAALLDSLASTTKEYAYLSWQANWLAVQNLKQQFAKHTFHNNAIARDSMLSVSSMAYVYNYALNQARVDTLPTIYMHALASKNPTLSDNLTFGALYPAFYSGNKAMAIERMTGLVKEGGDKNVLYRKVLGHWLLQLGLYEQANEQFSEVPGAEGTVGQAVANAFSDKGIITTILLDKLKEKDPSIEQLKNTLLSSKRPQTKTDTLLASALKSPSLAHFEAAIRSNPFDENTVSAASEYLRKNGQIKKAYDIVLTALSMNVSAPRIWEQYTFLSLEQGLLSQADEGEAQIKALASAADYQQFVTRYQPQRALIEKQRAEFH